MHEIYGIVFCDKELIICCKGVRGVAGGSGFRVVWLVGVAGGCGFKVALGVASEWL